MTLDPALDGDGIAMNRCQIMWPVPVRLRQHCHSRCQDQLMTVWREETRRIRTVGVGGHSLVNAAELHSCMHSCMQAEFNEQHMSRSL